MAGAEVQFESALLVSTIPNMGLAPPMRVVHVRPSWEIALGQRFAPRLPYTGETMTPTHLASALLFVTTLAHPLQAQSSGAAKRTSTTTHRAASTGNPADHPPGVPAVHGLPKFLYSLRYVDILMGSGELAAAQKYYTVRYTGWTTDGKKFDSSDDHPGKDPITFPYGAHRVIMGWDTGFQGMHVGGKRRLFVPYQLAYGESGRPPVIPARADLIFDVELVSMSDTPPPPPPTAPAPAEPSGTPNPSAKPTPPATAPTAPTSGQHSDPTKPTTAPAPTAGHTGS